MRWIEDTVLPETSKGLIRLISFGELLIFIGTWLLINVCPGHAERDFSPQKKLT